ncbi:AmmeMemoRadiSam system protein A [Marinobacterium aestuariivivens]|uniref:AmmeMemoRadiSam system protein A n=1 Tax=Marinobacterium aestuariivivens TaxID=1698799 RepID=A0ABW2A7T3_9GAMM
MAPTASTEPSRPLRDKYSASERALLLRTARAAIARGLETGEPEMPDPETAPQALRCPRACFVTLKKQGELRGCIGSLEASRPLLCDVAVNAWHAATRDPRFAPVTAEELPGLQIELSILTPLEPLVFRDEQDLLAQIVPGRDGLLLQYGRRRGTFLPSVWEQLPELGAFWANLKHKAGLASDFWHPDLRCWRYRAIKVVEAEQGVPVKQNLLAGLPQRLDEERFEPLLKRKGLRLERILSFGQSTPDGQWYDQAQDEWVLLLQGEAELEFEQGRRLELEPGDAVMLPARCRHRVARTRPGQVTLWLALHLNAEESDEDE